MDKKRLQSILEKIEDVSIAVVGDFFLDEYIYIDPAKNEVSLETGLVAYQAVSRVISPGAAGTVAKDLTALGVGTVYAVGYIGGDGRGQELRQELVRAGVNCENLAATQERVTPTYTKPMLSEGNEHRELNRIDIKNWSPTPLTLENDIIVRVQKLEKNLNAIIVLDQLTERNHGVVTDRVRNALSFIAEKNKDLIVYADSRCFISEFRHMMIKCNQYEIMRSDAGESLDASDPDIVKQHCREASHKNGKPVIVTMGEKGAVIAADGQIIEIPAVKVPGPVDICGAGDAFTSGIVSALSCGANLYEAGLIGNLVASVCITQIGTTGSATANQVIVQYDVF